MVVQTQSPDAGRAEYAEKLLEMNKCLLKRWCGGDGLQDFT